MVVERLGSGSRVVLVHGSMSGPAVWSRQRRLAQRYRLELVARPGFPPNPPAARIDFAHDAPLVAALVGEGAHLVGHSYGGVVALLAAAARPEAVRSLTVLEPPCFDVARGHPAVEAFVAATERLWAGGPADPRAFAATFLALVGAEARLTEPLPPDLAQTAQALQAERLPSEAVVPIERLAGAGIPALVVSGGHHPAFDAVCDALERGLSAHRAVVPGAGHAIPRVGEPFTALLDDFFTSSEQGLSPSGVPIV